MIDGHRQQRYCSGMEKTAELFKSLAEETRLRLLVLLHRGHELCVCDLMQALDMPQSTVSRHLAYLKRSGWLHDRKGGVWMYYSLNRDMDAFQQAQYVLLINQLAGLAICRADRQRLETHLHNKSCTSCGEIPAAELEPEN